MPRFEPYTERTLTRARTDPPLEFEIRPATLDDVTAVSQIHASRDGGEPSELAEAIARFVVTADASGYPLLMVAEHQGAVVGFGKIRYFTQPDDAPPNVAQPGWYLFGLVVRSDQRRRGDAMSYDRRHFPQNGVRVGTDDTLAVLLPFLR